MTRIGEWARKQPNLVFTSLYHLVADLDVLRVEVLRRDQKSKHFALFRIRKMGSTAEQLYVNRTIVYILMDDMGFGECGIPRDRIVDSVDQTAIFLKGDTHAV